MSDLRALARSGGPATTAQATGAAALERPLTEVEQTVLLSGRRADPIMVGIVVRFDGRLDAGRMGDAVRAALLRHPMARAQLGPDRSGVPHWRIPPAAIGPTRVFEAADVDTGYAALVAEPMRLDLEPAVRFGLISAPGGDAVGALAHHAVMDGRSLLRLVTDVASGYLPPPGSAASPGSTGRPAPPRPRDPGDPRPVPSDLGRGPARGRLARSTRAPRPGYGNLTIVRTAPPRPVWPAGAKANDALLVGAHLAVQRWNAAQGCRTGTVRMRMPVNKWVPGSDLVTNATAQAMITSTPVERADVRALATAIVAQTAQAKAGGSLVEHSPLALLRPLPARARRAAARAAIELARPAMMPSLALSNLGRVERVPVAPGAPAVTGMQLLAFAGMPQGLAIGAAGYDGRLYLSLGYHRRLFDAPAAARFAGLLETALDEVDEALGLSDG